jgi:rhodanese-related sulfurtransferase
MGEILRAYPSAKVGLFQRYHIGGCAACGYEAWETLEQVLQKHDVKEPVDAVLQCIKQSDQVELSLSISAKEIVEARERGDTIRLLDVRKPEAFEAEHLPGADLLTVELTFEALDTWPKDTRMVFYSDDETRSLDRASYFRAYGFANAKSLAGGMASMSGAGVASRLGSRDAAAGGGRAP